MKEIKFKCIRGENNAVIKSEQYHSLEYYFQATGDKDQLQFTEEKDIKGNEIYHNDIVSNGLNTYLVVWHESSWKIKRGVVHHNINADLRDLEVIGNIHTSPKLLK